MRCCCSLMHSKVLTNLKKKVLGSRQWEREVRDNRKGKICIKNLSRERDSSNRNTRKERLWDRPSIKWMFCCAAFFVQSGKHQREKIRNKEKTRPRSLPLLLTDACLLVGGCFYSRIMNSSWCFVSLILFPFHGKCVNLQQISDEVSQKEKKTKTRSIRWRSNETSKKTKFVPEIWSSFLTAIFMHDLCLIEITSRPWDFLCIHSNNNNQKKYVTKKRLRTSRTGGHAGLFLKSLS